MFQISQFLPSFAILQNCQLFSFSTNFANFANFTFSHLSDFQAFSGVFQRVTFSVPPNLFTRFSAVFSALACHLGKFKVVVFPARRKLSSSSVGTARSNKAEIFFFFFFFGAGRQEERRRKKEN
jgi:hypothetical protein